ncbi:MAG: response regulator [Flavipsychrobacter sp.]|nr:response regulator [Flavipsychrobacter sp.]
MKKCLLIEDDLDDQEIFLMCLEKVCEDVECTTMNDGVSAISMLRSNPEYVPDYIFIDVNMPKMTGIECLRILKQMEKLMNARIYMYSTTAEGLALEESKKLQASDFFIKPSNISALEEQLAMVFKSNR